jgi:hypothetical protein
MTFPMCKPCPDNDCKPCVDNLHTQVRPYDSRCDGFFLCGLRHGGRRHDGRGGLAHPDRPRRGRLERLDELPDELGPVPAPGASVHAGQGLRRGRRQPFQGGAGGPGV